MASLQSLPVEILFHILAFTGPFRRISPHDDPLCNLAASSKLLQDVVEAYARGLLKQRKSVVLKRRRGEPYRKTWRRWVSNTCQTCKKKSVRAAILDPGVTCCVNCDRKIPKMTKTDAVTKHHLSLLDLFTPNFLHPDLPPVTSGEYMCMGGMATMILTEDVLARKQYIVEQTGNQDESFLHKRQNLLTKVQRDLRLYYKGGRWWLEGRLGMDTTELLLQFLNVKENVRKTIENPRAHLGLSLEARRQVADAVVSFLKAVESSQSNSLRMRLPAGLSAS
ncbi:hypothetical protein M011DRAFT_460398 [Sporormia fimetaria CBS 119925]|uniref:Uncharacterized protein n=1 Tax=Sporormia fimetaria CBS 119925 TaxID=1340428 RepID=A0A6A6V579_9PLEO|nr:hypothetical protein M011DRAFT_460398 [Sporormia fimetaria CBS 119925]